MRKKNQRKRTKRKQRITQPGRVPSSGTNPMRPAMSSRTQTRETSNGKTTEQGILDTLEWVNSNPRRGAMLNVAVSIVPGIMQGLLMATLSTQFTGNLTKIWVYAVNTAIGLALKTAMQWFWILWATPFVNRIGRRFFHKITGQKIPENVGELALRTDQTGTIIVPAVTSTAIATILVTENLSPGWLNETLHVLWITAIGGALGALAEALSVPANIHALARNRHRHHGDPDIPGKRRQGDRDG